MKLPFFTKDKKFESSYYLALLLTDEKASSVILQEEEGKLKTLGKHEEFFADSIEKTSLEDLTNILDKTISIAEEILPPNIETHKTVFGVKETWVEKETKKISKEYLIKLKKICDALDLTPIGFMVVTEAISHLLQEREGAPLSAILAEVGNKKVNLTLFRGGKVAEQISGALTGSAPKTVDTLLQHFTTAVLPARIILYDAKEAEKLSQQFIGHQWSKSLPFLHVPQITVLPAGFDAQAITFGAATQMGFELLDSDNDSLIEPFTQEGEEITERPEKPKHDDKTESEETAAIHADNFGFVMDADITKQPHAHTKAAHPTEHHKEMIINDPTEDLYKNDTEAYDKERPAKPAVSHMFAMFKTLRLPKFASPRLPLRGNRRLVLPAVILGTVLLVILGLIFFYTTSVKATILIAVKPNMVDQTKNVTFSPTAPNDFSQNTIAGKSITTTVDGKVTGNATGKKEVGEKAKGTVTVYNNDTDPVKLSSGTTIKSANNVSFLLDKDITVASASGDVFSGTKPGTTEVTVTAEKLGTEGNLPSGTKFTIGSNSSLAAKNDSAFSGGTKKQVTVISKSDVEKLRTELPKSLEQQAKASLAQKVGGDETALPVFLTNTLTQPKFDNEVDKEAKQVTLTAKVTFEGLAYKNEDLKNYVKALLKEQMSRDENIAEDKLNITVENPEVTKDEEVEANVVIEAGVLPKIDTNEVIQKIEGKSLSETKTVISDLPQVIKSEITFSPFVPLLPSILPWLPKQVTVEVRPE